MFLEAGASDTAIHFTLGTSTLVVVAKIARDWLQERNGNNLGHKLDTLIGIAEKQQESLDELVVASRVTEELRKARGASG